jgi:hypothetical protein
MNKYVQTYLNSLHKSAGILGDLSQSAGQVGQAAMNSPIGQSIQGGVSAVKNSPIGQAVTGGIAAAGSHFGAPSMENFKRNSGYNTLRNSPLGESVAQVGSAVKNSPIGQTVTNGIKGMAAGLGTHSMENFKINSGYNGLMNSLSSLGHRINDDSPIPYRPIPPSAPAPTSGMTPLQAGEKRIAY